MKKQLKFFAAALLMIGAVASCSKPDNGKNGNDDGDNNGPSEEGAIVIDGKWYDWNAIPEDELVASKLDPDSDKTAIRTIKFFNTEQYLYVYAELDPEKVGTAFTESEKWDSGKGQPRSLRFMIDEDNSDTTGGSDIDFPEAEWGIDVLVDAYIWADAGNIKLGWSECWNFKQDAEVGYPFIGLIEQNTALDNMVVTPNNVAGNMVKGFYAVELAIDKTLLDLEKTIKVGVFLVDDAWVYAGMMPSDGIPFTLNL